MYGKNVKKIKYWGKGEETMKKKYRKLAAVFAAVMALGTLNAPISGVFAGRSYSVRSCRRYDNHSNG